MTVSARNRVTWPAAGDKIGHFPRRHTSDNGQKLAQRQREKGGIVADLTLDNQALKAVVAKKNGEALVLPPGRGLATGGVSDE
jgi:hypothetical protein